MAVVAPAVCRSGWKAILKMSRSYLHPSLSVIGGLLLWEFVAQHVITNRLIIVPLSTVARTTWSLAQSGELWKHLSASGMEFLLGFSLAAASGILGGFLMGTSTGIREYLEPTISALYATPLVALIPFYIIVFGISPFSKVALAFTVAVFPILINTYIGVLSVDRQLLEVAASFGATRPQAFLKVQIPAALPFIVSGLRLGVGRALTGVVVGEFFFATAGLGYMISLAAQTFDTARVFVGVVVVILAGILAMVLLGGIERRMASWRPQ
jgi:NitT/TauT family transport system permease protein